MATPTLQEFYEIYCELDAYHQILLLARGEFMKLKKKVWFWPVVIVVIGVTLTYAIVDNRPWAVVLALLEGVVIGLIIAWS